MLRTMRTRRAALRYAAHDWPVAPGAYRARRSAYFDCGEPGCRPSHPVACHPVQPNWELAATVDAAQIRRMWRIHPYSVLLATGHSFDVLEVPTALGRQAVEHRDAGRGVRGPVAVAPGGRWMFFVRPGHTLLPELAWQHDVVLHGPGSWVPAPPSEQLGGRVHWEVSPADDGWRLAEPYTLQATMLATLPPRRTRWTARQPVPAHEVA